MLFDNYNSEIPHNDFDLTPIKKEWYEKEENFPCLMYRAGDDDYSLVRNRTVALERLSQDFRPTTKEELLSLLVEH